MKNFWNFVGEHPVFVFFMSFLVLSSVVSIVQAICGHSCSCPH
jgi:hypothetical protein